MQRAFWRTLLWKELIEKMYSSIRSVDLLDSTSCAPPSLMVCLSALHILLLSCSPCQIPLPLHYLFFSTSIISPFLILSHLPRPSSHLLSSPSPLFPLQTLPFIPSYPPGWWRTLHPSSSTARFGASSDPRHSKLTLCQALQPREHLHVRTRWRCWKQLGQWIRPGKQKKNFPPNETWGVMLRRPCVIESYQVAFSRMM